MMLACLDQVYDEYDSDRGRWKKKKDNVFYLLLFPVYLFDLADGS